MVLFREMVSTSPKSLKLFLILSFNASSISLVFNKFIRARDKDLPCISCGRVKVEWTRGGEWDCGHYRSRGAMMELRFEELNAHKQCKSCNGGSAKYAKKGYTVGKEYTERLTARIGEDKVAWLNGPHEPKKYTIEELKELKKLYQGKLKSITRG